MLSGILYKTGTAVTPSDSTADPAGPFDALICAVSGNIAVIDKSGNSYTIPACQAGIFYPCECVQVKVTGTAATGIVGMKMYRTP